MVRMFRLLLVVVCLGLGVLKALAQAPVAPVAPPQPDPLPGLPRPPDEPRSLFLQAPPAPTWPALPVPYLQPDPQLDPPLLPQPGWFGDAELLLTAPFVKSKLNSPIFTQQLPLPHLDWTASPRFEAGYRLPSGFGGFALAYRFLAGDATEGFVGPDGPGVVAGRLDLNAFDFDYQSDEISLWPHWEMKWWFGARLVNIYFDSRAVEPVEEALAGTGIVASRSTDRYIGAGPHWGLRLERRFDECGLAIVGRIDGFIGLGRQRQGFFEQTAAVGPDGQPIVAQDHVRSSQAVPALTAQIGLSWEPPGWMSFSAFLGYQYEKWWNVGRLNRIGSSGELEDQGVALQATFNY
jgi:hypothetical protein